MRDQNEVKEWLNKAENDYEGALHLFRRRKQPLPDLVCFHCQQAAEKYLKAFLIHHKKPFPKTHDLILLLEMCIEFHSNLETYRELFENLNPYSVQFRYPGEEAHYEEAQLAVKTIKQIRNCILELFPLEILQGI